MIVHQRIKMLVAMLALLVSPLARIQAQTDGTSRAAITGCLQAYMQCYPQSQLRDLYKFCFQDFFGPEHIVTDSLGAVNYINYEMAHADSTDWLNPLFVYPLGLDSNYLRVDINYVRLGIVPMDVFVSALLESVALPSAEPGGQARRPDLSVWRWQWQQILYCLQEVTPRPLNFTADSAEIAQTLLAGNYAMHHSPLFNGTYRQHYRIIRRDVFFRRLSAYIPNPQSPCSRN